MSGSSRQDGHLRQPTRGCKRRHQCILGTGMPVVPPSRVLALRASPLPGVPQGGTRGTCPAAAAASGTASAHTSPRRCVPGCQGHLKDSAGREKGVNATQTLGAPRKFRCNCTARETQRGGQGKGRSPCSGWRPLRAVSQAGSCSPPPWQWQQKHIFHPGKHRDDRACGAPHPCCAWKDIFDLFCIHWDGWEDTAVADSVRDEEQEVTADDLLCHKHPAREEQVRQSTTLQLQCQSSSPGIA